MNNEYIMIEYERQNIVIDLKKYSSAKSNSSTIFRLNWTHPIVVFVFAFAFVSVVPY